MLKDWVQQPGSLRKIALEIPCIDADVRVRLPDDLQVSERHEASRVAWDQLGEKMPCSAEDRLELQWQERLDVRVFDTLRRVATVGTEDRSGASRDGFEGGGGGCDAWGRDSS